MGIFYYLSQRVTKVIYTAVNEQGHAHCICPWLNLVPRAFALDFDSKASILFFSTEWKIAVLS